MLGGRSDHGKLGAAYSFYRSVPPSSGAAPPEEEVHSHPAHGNSDPDVS